MGLITLLDDHVSQIQEIGAEGKHHNTVPRTKRIQILHHAICDPEDVVGYVYRYIISFGMSHDVTSTAM